MENGNEMIWYDKHWKEKETPEFVEWFTDYYGVAGDFSPNLNEQEEYWVRRSFALMGWLAANGELKDNATSCS